MRAPQPGARTLLFKTDWKGGVTMETFVQRIIDTDRRARQVIEQARQEKKRLLEQARQQADSELARQEEAARAGRRAVDEEMARRARQAGEAADADYLAKKHALDAAFEEHREAWLRQITDAVLAEG